MKKNVIIGLIVSILLISVGVSYAYWRGVVKGEGAPMTLNFDDVRVIFTDDTTLSSGEVKPGWSVSKMFTIKNESSDIFKYDILIEGLINTFVLEGGLQYKITSNNNGYNMSEFVDVPKSSTASDVVLVYSVPVEALVTQEYTIEFRYQGLDVDQSEDMGKTFGCTLAIREGTNDPKLLYNKILADHPIVNTRTDFDNVFGSSTATTGVIYKESTYRETGGNNNKDVYYFAGNVADNWVQFGGYLWRIIRTNEDGSVRLLYHGTSTTATDAYIANNQAYNSSYNNTMYVGYMYGTTGSIANNRKNTTSSPIKTTIDNWYKNNILSSYDGYVSKTAIYCNDRAAGQYSSSGSMFYAAYLRLSLALSQPQPTYQCGQNTKGSAYTSSAAHVADKFSVNTGSGGNGKLQYPIALMTADEISFAGGLYGTNAPNTYYYLNSSGGSSTGSNWWWTMSPYYFDSGNGNAGVFFVFGFGSPGGLNNAWVYNTSAVRPVLSLKSCVLVSSGNGTASNPYKVEVNSACSSTVN